MLDYIITGHLPRLRQIIPPHTLQNPSSQNSNSNAPSLAPGPAVGLRWAEVKNLETGAVCFLHRRHAAPVVEAHLPHGAADVIDEIADKATCAGIP